MDFLKLAQEYEKEMINDLSQLVAIPSLLDESTISAKAPFGQPIREALDWILNKAEKDGFSVYDVNGYAGRVSYGNQKESVSLLGHLDVVPVSDGWFDDPFKVIIKDGYLVGRGVSDDKGPTIAAYYALKILKEQNIQFKHRLDLIVGCDEESEMRCMEYYANHEPLPLMGFVPDAFFPGVFAEKGILNFDIVCKNDSIISQMTAGQRPNIVIDKANAKLKKPLSKDTFDFYIRSNELEGQITDTKMSVIGKAFHASYPFRGVNAGLHLLNYVATETNHQSLKSIVNLLKDPFGMNLGIDFESSMMGFLTMNTGIITIDEDEIRFTIDIRYPIELNALEIVDKVQSKFDWKIENVLDSRPHYVDQQSDLVKTALRAYQKITKDMTSSVKTMGGGTYARTLPNHMAFGAEIPNRIKPSWAGGAHETNEAFEIDSLIMATAIYCEALCEIGEAIL